MKKRFLAWLLTTALVLTNIPMVSFAADYTIGDTYTSSSESDTPPTDIPDGTVWDGPQYTRTCPKAVHQHDRDCYCEHGGTGFSHWWHDDAPDGCLIETPGCNMEEHTHSVENGCYSYSWVLEEVSTSAQYRTWWPVYWGFEDGSRVTSSDVVKVTTGRDNVKFASTTISASTGLSDVENGETVTSGDVIENAGFVVEVEPGYYVVSWRLVCGNRFRCETNDYQDRNYTANSDGDYTSELIVPMNGESFNHWNGFDIQNSNPSRSYYVPVIAPKSTDSNLYNSSAPHPFYLMVYVQQDSQKYQIDYNWGALTEQLNGYSVPESEHNVIRNASYKVADPDVYGGETAANELGYRFIGWQITGEGYDNGATVQPGADITCYGSNITLTALWETTVTYQYTGEIPEGAEDQLPDIKHYEVGELVTVEDEPDVPGYTFSGWTTDDVDVTDGYFDMPSNPVVFTGSFDIDEDQTKTLKYTVRYWLDGVHQENMDVTKTSEPVWVNAPDTMLFDQSLRDVADNTWIFTNSKPTWIADEIDDVDQEAIYVNDKAVIDFYYKTAQHAFSLDKTVKDPSGMPVTTAAVGDTLTYTITVKNTGDLEMTNVVVEDSPNGTGSITLIAPAEGVEHVTHTEGGYQMDRFTIASIPKDSEVRIVYTYKVQPTDAGTTLVNNAFCTYDGKHDEDHTSVEVTEQYMLTVEHYLDGELDESKTFTETMDYGKLWSVQVGAEPDATYNAPTSITVSGVTYAFDVPATRDVDEDNAASGTLDADTTVKLYYAKDEIGTENPDEPDDIPDKYQATILYKAEHGGVIKTGALTKEVVTVYDEDGIAEKGYIVASGSEAEAHDHYEFAQWTLERENHAAFETGLHTASFSDYRIPPVNDTTDYIIGGETYIFRAHFIGAELELIKSATVFSKERSAAEQSGTPVAEVGDTIEYEIHVHNIGTVHLKSLQVTDTMQNASGEIRYHQNENSNLVSYDAEENIFTVTDLQPGQVVTIVYYYDVIAADAGKTIENAAVADLAGDDDPTATEDVYVKEIILSVEKTAVDYEVAAGETITWNIVVTNSGTDAGYTELPVDTLTILEEGQQPVTTELTVIPAEGLVAENDGTFEVPAGGSITFLATYVSRADGVVLQNTVSIGGDSYTDEPVTVLKNYTVTYELRGEIPAGLNAVYAGPTEYAEKDNVPVLAEPEYNDEAYGFSGWTCEEVEVNDGSFTMPAKNITFIGVFEAKNPDIEVTKNTLKINDEDYVNGTSVAKPGDWITWTITVKNDGNASGKYTLSDQLAGVTVYDEAGQPVSPIQEHTIAAGATQTFTAKYQIKDTDTGSIVNSVKLSSGDEDDTDGEEVPISNLNVKDKKVVKVGETEIIAGVTIPEAKAGDSIVWAITILNTGDAEATLNVADLADTVQYWNGANWVDFTDDLGKVTFNVNEITVPAAGEASVLVTWVVPTEAYGKTVRNLVDADPDDGEDPAPEIPSEEIEVEDEPKSGLVVDKTVNRTDVEVGDTIIYTIKIKNTGNVKLVDVVVDESAFSGKFDKITNVEFSASDISLDKEHDRFVIEDLAAEEEVTISFSYRTTAEGTLKNTVKVTGQPDRDDDGDPDPDLPDSTTEDKAPDVDVDDDEDPIPPVGPKPELDKTGDHLSYIIGFPDGTVQPLGTITRAEVATIFFRLLTDESRAYYWSQTNNFSDVAADAWYNNAISTMAAAGILNGYPDGTFRPYDPVSRAEFAAIATRFTEEGRDGVSQKFFKQYFKDVDQSDWYAAAVELAYELGWAQGYEGSYRPEDDMTRAEAMTLVNRIMEREVRIGDMLEDMIHWPDNTPDKWYYEAVQEATNSHTYKRTDVKVPYLDFNYEEWKKLLENPDWAALERIWSDANSQN